jgi:plasmid stabilization system protein ParE
MATLRLTRKAREDLKSIARVTQKSWGVAQRNKYLTQLVHASRCLLTRRLWAVPAMRSVPATASSMKVGI